MYACRGKDTSHQMEGMCSSPASPEGIAPPESSEGRRSPPFFCLLAWVLERHIQCLLIQIQSSTMVKALSLPLTLTCFIASSYRHDSHNMSSLVNPNGQCLGWTVSSRCNCCSLAVQLSRCHINMSTMRVKCLALAWVPVQEPCPLYF